MLTLDQVRAVNDGFKSGDLNAALRPLEETIDLRSNELPRLDKAALAALKAGLENDDSAAIWAQALLHPNISVRRFARKVFMGLGDEAEPLFAPLRQRLERYWSEEKPLAESNKAREAALRRDQREMVNGALEILLRAQPEKFLEFYADIVDVTPVGDNAQSQAMQEWQDRNREAWQVTQAEVDRLLTDEWGSEWTEPAKRWKLPSRVLRELDERARQKSEVAALWAQLGENPWERAAVEWNPTQLLWGALSGYLLDGNLTGPMQRVRDRIRPALWNWVRAAFDFESSTAERARNARRLGSNNGWGFGAWLGTKRLKAEMPALLVQAKAPLIEQLKQQVESEVGLYGGVAPMGEARLWLLLMAALGGAYRRPYNVSDEEWDVPAEVEPETLRQIVADFKSSRNNDYIMQCLRTAADEIEKMRKAGRGKAIKTEASAPDVNSEPVPTHELKLEGLSGADEDAAELIPNVTSTILRPYEVLADGELYGNQQHSPEFQAKVKAEVEKVEREINSIAGSERRVECLLETPSNVRAPHKIIPRLSYWRVWARELGENGGQKLKDELWNESAPKLWARVEAKLEEYRRAETDPVEPKIEQKLTERELKEWRAQMRRDTRGALAREIRDITELLFSVDGFEARLKIIEMADRPSCRDLRDQFEFALFIELERQQGNHAGLPASPTDWDAWKLGEEWEQVLRKAEAQLEKAKDGWSRSSLERQLATGYYRRGQFERFKEFASRPGVFPRVVAMAATATGDFEAWRVLIGVSERWGDADLTAFWTALSADPKLQAEAIKAVVATLATTSDEDVARRLLGWLGKTPPAELEPLVGDIENALESAVIAVKKWSMGALSALPSANFDRERAAATAGEALWNENAGLAKDAAKFLSQLVAQDPSVSETVWGVLCDATALDNAGVAEAVYRALSQVRAKNKALELPDTAREKLEALISVNAERFAKFEKKLG